MRILFVTVVPLLFGVACGHGPGVNPNRDGVYALPTGDGLTLSAANAGPGKCDWWSQKDFPDMSEDDLPGFCLADITTSGSVSVLWNPAHSAYVGSNVQVTTGGVSGERVSVKLTEVGSGGWLTFDLLVGDSADMSSAEVVSINVNAKRYRP